MQAGVGVSAYGDEAPGAFEVPFEVRLRQHIGFVNIHVWARGAYLFDDAREAEDSTALASSDEMGLGGAVSIPYGRDARFFGGASYEDRPAGNSGVIFIGISAGTSRARGRTCRRR